MLLRRIVILVWPLFANHRIIWPPSGAILLRNFNGLCVVVLELFSVVVVNF